MRRLVLVLLVCCCPLFAADEVAMAVHAVKVLHDNAKDPDSLVVEKIYANSKSDKPQLCIRYRARNGYGGYEKEMAKYKGDKLEPDVLGGCFNIERKWDWATKKGWSDITDQYVKAAAAPAEKP